MRVPKLVRRERHLLSGVALVFAMAGATALVGVTPAAAAHRVVTASTPHAAPNLIGRRPLVFEPTGTVRGRMYLLHGLSETPATFTAQPVFAGLIDGLRADGWQVIVPFEVCDNANPGREIACLQRRLRGSSDGARYDAEVQTAFARTNAYVVAKYGPPAGRRYGIIGISFGGLDTEILACSQSALRLFVAHEPATNPSVLSEFAGDNTSRVLPACCPLNGEPGRVSYGLEDVRVGYSATVAWGARAAAVDRGVTTVSYDQPHETTEGNVSDIVAWVGAHC